MTYQLFGSFQIVHDPFTIVTSSFPNTLCGSLSYSATFDTTTIDTESTGPITYDSDLLTFVLYSEDVNLIGSHTITLSAFLTDYPEIVSGEL